MSSTFMTQPCHHLAARVTPGSAAATGATAAVSFAAQAQAAPSSTLVVSETYGWSICALVRDTHSEQGGAVSG
jgi:hypothetical protein